MSLYIRDQSVDDLAQKLQRMLGAKTKTEAVRLALEHEIERKKSVLTLRERIKPFQDRIAALGPDQEDVDMKAFMDELSGGI